MAMHCHGAAAMNQGASQGTSMDCTCSISQTTASIVPPTAFHFTLHLSFGQSVNLPTFGSSAIRAASADLLAGFGGPRRQPPRA
jgi:hypothetical protein